MKKLQPLLTAAVSPLTPASPAPAEMERRSFAAQPGGLLVAQVEWGSIEVHSWERPMVDVVLEGAAELELKFVREEGRATVHAGRIDPGSSVLSRILEVAARRPAPRLRLTLPQSHDVDLETAGGNIGLNRLQGSVRARTAGGDFSCVGVKGSVEARTAGGDIRIEDLEGDLVARSSGGDIRLARVRGAVNVCAGEGNTYLRFPQQPREPCRLGTAGGEVEVSLPPDTGLRVDARTAGGCITTDFPLTVRGTLERNGFKASINGGGPLLTLCTSGGPIRLHKLQDCHPRISPD